VSFSRVAAAALCCALTAAAPPEPDDYRTNAYNAATPATLRGAKVLTIDQARALWERHDAVFVDVLPQAPRPAGLPPGTIWRQPRHTDIPGSFWLPDTGYGELAAVTEQYFDRGLTKATAGDHARTLVFYCRPACWMSWNAAKRAIALGYTNVDWFPGGDAAWQSTGLKLEPRDPEPRPEPP
jgi:PQQ-dependent catabolism-associated CXXCW motif protein